MRGDSGVAGEGRVVGVPRFHSWGKFTMPLTNINSDWMSNASSGLCIIFYYIIFIILFILYYAGPLSCILGCNVHDYTAPSGYYSSNPDLASCPDPTPHEEEKGSGYNTTSCPTIEGRNQMPLSKHVG